MFSSKAVTCWRKKMGQSADQKDRPRTWKMWNCHTQELFGDIGRFEQKKNFFKHRTKTNKVWKSDMPAINKQLLVDKDVSDRLLSNHFRHYNQFGDWPKSRLSDWCSPPRQVFLFRNPSTCIFKNFRGYSRIVKDTQGFSRIFKDCQG